jgi:hypothetical protein
MANDQFLMTFVLRNSYLVILPFVFSNGNPGLMAHALLPGRALHCKSSRLHTGLPSLWAFRFDPYCKYFKFANYC